MSKGRFNYYDPEYNPNNTDGTELLLMINSYTFSFIVLQTETQKVLIWGENYQRNELETPAELNQILTAPYHQVKVIVNSGSFAVIPKELFEQAGVAEYGRFLTVTPADSVLVNELDKENYVAFSISNTLLDTLKKYTDVRSIYFTGKVLISAINTGKHSNANLYLHAEENNLQVLYFKEGLLNFYNIYQFNNPDELMYFVVLSTNELGLNSDDTTFILSGEVNIADKKILRLTELMPKVSLNQAKIVLLPPGFLPHQILLLSGLTLCESLVEN